MLMMEYAFENEFKPLEKAICRSVLYYIAHNHLDVGDKNSFDLACKSLNLTKKKLTECLEDFEQDGLISIGDGFPGIDVTLTKTGIAFINKYCRQDAE
jgi:hypothetical protein